MEKKKNKALYTGTAPTENGKKIAKPRKTRRKKKESVYKQSVKQYFDSANQLASDRQRDAPGLCFFSQCINAEHSNNRKNNNENWEKQKLKNLGWGSEVFTSKPIDTCRCELCELRNMVKQAGKRCKTFVLLDLDNWGWDQWSSCNKKSSIKLKSDDNLSDIFCWAFYGSGFLSHLPSEEDKELFMKWESQILKCQTNKVHNSTSEISIFEHFLRNNTLRLSPTGWSDQSADLAIRKMCKLLLQKVNVCVITRDQDLSLECDRIADSIPETKSKNHKFICIKPNIIGYKAVIPNLLQFHQDVS